MAWRQNPFCPKPARRLCRARIRSDGAGFWGLLNRLMGQLGVKALRFARHADCGGRRASLRRIQTHLLVVAAQEIRLRGRSLTGERDGVTRANAYLKTKVGVAAPGNPLRQRLQQGIVVGAGHLSEQPRSDKPFRGQAAFFQGGSLGLAQGQPCLCVCAWVNWRFARLSRVEDSVVNNVLAVVPTDWTRPAASVGTNAASASG